MLEASLSYLHILMILSMTVFLSSEAALCRQEWMNAKVVHRLARLTRHGEVIADLPLADHPVAGTYRVLPGLVPTGVDLVGDDGPTGPRIAAPLVGQDGREILGSCVGRIRSRFAGNRPGDRT